MDTVKKHSRLFCSLFYFLFSVVLFSIVLVSVVSGNVAGGPDMVCIDIADAPLTTQFKAAPPLVMLLLDDSGSMAWDILCPEPDGAFGGRVYVEDVPKYWKSQWNGYNGVYYDPNVIYEPWPTKSNADPDNPRINPTKTATQKLNNEFTEIKKISIPYAHYYTWSILEEEPYLVTLGGSAKYYALSLDSGSINRQQVTKLTEVTGNSVPEDVKITYGEANFTTYTEARQNFANWYSYSRNRDLMAKASLSQVINDSSDIKLGIYTLHARVKEAVRLMGSADDDANKLYMLNKLYSVRSSGGTPLRAALKTVGQYFDATDTNEFIGKSPYASESVGGACQQAFVIAMTDGYYNGATPSGGFVGNADGDDSSSFDGAPFGDDYSDTLADVAMYYYEKDLSPMANSLKVTPAQVLSLDTATHQHMVTYTISMGLTGTMATDPTPDCPSDITACPPTTTTCDSDNENCEVTTNWPKPDTGAKKIDDLWHAAVNGRGDFLLAKSASGLTTALKVLFEDIDARTKTGASVALSTNKIQTSTTIYQTYFDSAVWAGDLKASSLLTPTVSTWSAFTQLEKMAATNRNIITFNGSVGIPFRHGYLTDPQKTMLTSDEVDYIRGDSTMEAAKDNGGSFRDRIWRRDDGEYHNVKLGDMVNSSPLSFKDMVFVGANDGMLHCFNAVTGDEKFAYIPGRVFKNLKKYTTQTYSHTYYVDNTPYAATVDAGTPDETSYLVGSLGRGGRGVFGIDISDTSKITEAAISQVTIWEYPELPDDAADADDADDDMGFSYSDVAILKTNAMASDGVTEIDSLIMFSNGYDSKNGKAVLYFLNLDGTLFTKIDTGSGGTTSELCNGLSSPTPIDEDSDGKIDYVYAGDLLGNLWKFDLTDEDPKKWDVAYKDGSSKKPLFQAKAPGGTLQPITSKPDVLRHCDGDKKGYIVVFGTGRYLTLDDIASIDVQSIYGIWDWADEWEVNSKDPAGKYLGYLKPPAPVNGVRKLSNIYGNSDFSKADDLTLLQQTEISFAGSPLTLRKMTNTDIKWFRPKSMVSLTSGDTYSGGVHVGWYFDLPIPGEKIISDVQIMDGKAIFVTNIPANSMCTSGGRSVVHVIDACNGGQVDSPQFDTDLDGDVDDDDEDAGGYEIPDLLANGPVINGADLIIDGLNIKKIKPETTGMYYWRLID